MDETEVKQEVTDIEGTSGKQEEEDETSTDEDEGILFLVHV